MRPHLLAALACLVGAGVARAEPAGGAAEARSTRRAAVDLAAGFVGDELGGGPDGALVLSKPLWLSGGSVLQVEASARALVGVGHPLFVHAGAALSGGAHLYLGRRLSLEVHVGPWASAAIGLGLGYEAPL